MLGLLLISEVIARVGLREDLAASLRQARLSSRIQRVDFALMCGDGVVLIRLRLLHVAVDVRRVIIEFRLVTEVKSLEAHDLRTEGVVVLAVLRTLALQAGDL